MTSNAYQPGRAASKEHDAALAVFSPDAKQLLYGSYLGGLGIDYARHIGIHPDGNSVYITGETTSLDFPLVNARQTEPSRGFLAKFSLAQGTRASMRFSGPAQLAHATPARRHSNPDAVAHDGELREPRKISPADSQP